MKPAQVRIALTLEDGRVAIMCFATHVELDASGNGFAREASAENVQAEVDRTFPPTNDEGTLDYPNGRVMSWRILQDHEVPSDRSYRDAWRDDGERIVHDLPKARAIHRERLRAKRKPLLEALDVEAIRADEDGDSARKRDVVARKRRLRDVTADPRIEAATTIDELKAIDVE